MKSLHKGVLLVYVCLDGGGIPLSICISYMMNQLSYQLLPAAVMDYDLFKNNMILALKGND